MQPSIRPATSGDLAAVEDIVGQAYAKYVPRIGRKPAPMLDDYAALIAAGHVFVMSSNDGIEGLLVLIQESGGMLLDNVALRPEAQGHGYGRQLIAFAERFARDAGCESIRLYTHEKMTENIALYSRLGFVETGRGEQKGLARVFMSKHLPSGDDVPGPTAGPA